jgi:hypothetical protein
VIGKVVKVPNVPRVWRFAAGESAAQSAVRRASPAAKRAFYHGIVKNQQGSATEVWQIGRSEKICTSGFPTLP